MKKVLCLILMAVMLAGCTPGVQPTPGSSSDTSVPGQVSGKNNYNIVGIDALGRTVNAVSGEKNNKYVGCFYWLWHGQHYGPDVYDVSKLLEEAPDELWSVEGTKNSVTNMFHWWGEPLYGYYSSEDEWVLRRHLEMFAYAGVDFLAIDLSNSAVYLKPIKMLMSLMQEYRSEGFDCPQITFFTHVDSKGVVEQLYNEIYSKNLYQDAWWCPYEDGKPYMIAYADPDMEGVVMGNGVKRGQYSAEIADFFHFKAPQWPDEEFVADSFPWIDWGRYPQADHTNVISVSPAIGPGAPMSHALTWPSTHMSQIWGRGWNGVVNLSSRTDEGLLFQSQWDYLLENDPEIAFIDGWNEWLTQKIVMNPETSPEIIFCDAVNEEFSRDCEPMKGGYADNFLMQMAYNIRAFKGVETDAAFRSITEQPDWDNASAIFYDFGTDNSERRHMASWGSTRYKQEAGRVNIQEVRVMHDNENLYFKISCENEVCERLGADWMNLFIGTGNVALKGWEGYEYVINRSGTGSIDKLSEDFSLTAAGNCTVHCEGSNMYVTIPRSSMGLDGAFSIYFKVADTITSPADISDYYVSGQSMPMGRFSFWYNAV